MLRLNRDRDLLSTSSLSISIFRSSALLHLFRLQGRTLREWSFQSPFSGVQLCFGLDGGLANAAAGGGFQSPFSGVQLCFDRGVPTGGIPLQELSISIFRSSALLQGLLFCRVEVVNIFQSPFSGVQLCFVSFFSYGREFISSFQSPFSGVQLCFITFI